MSNSQASEYFPQCVWLKNFRKDDMELKNQFRIVGSCLLGAAGMYLLDPHRGPYRRALVRDKLNHYQKRLRRDSTIVARDLKHRGMGFIAEARQKIVPREVSDDILVARVSSKLGRMVSNPHSIELTADGGKLFLSGPIFFDEAEMLLKAVRAIPGVRRIENRLELHSRSERHPALQGRRHLHGQKIDILQEQWSPATRFLVTLGGALVAMSTGWAIRRAA